MYLSFAGDGAWAQRQTGTGLPHHHARSEDPQIRTPDSGKSAHPAKCIPFRDLIFWQQQPDFSAPPQAHRLSTSRPRSAAGGTAWGSWAGCEDQPNGEGDSGAGTAAANAEGFGSTHRGAGGPDLVRENLRATWHRHHGLRTGHEEGEGTVSLYWPAHNHEH